MTQGEQLAAGRSDEIGRPALLFADERVAVYSAEARLFCDGNEISADVPGKALRIAAFLAEDPDRVIPHADLCKRIWSRFDNSSYDYLRAGIQRLRQAFGDELGDTEQGALRSVRGVGYYAIKSLAAGYTPETKPEDEAYQVASGRIMINASRWFITKDSQQLAGVTTDEFRLLRLLASRQDIIVPQADLCRVLFGSDTPAQRAHLRVMLTHLRAKLGPELGDKFGGAIVTMTGEGYVAPSQL